MKVIDNKLKLNSGAIIYFWHKKGEKMNKEMIFSEDRISTILNALDVYKARGIKSLDELDRVKEIKNFLNLILDKKANSK